MPTPITTRKLIASTFRKNAFKDLREDKGRVGVIDADIARRVEYIRKTHRSFIGIKPKEK